MLLKLALNLITSPSKVKFSFKICYNCRDK